MLIFQLRSIKELETNRVAIYTAMDPESRAMTKSITVMCDFMRDAATEVANAFFEEGFIPKDQHRKVLKDSGEVTSLWTSCLTARAKKKPEVLKKIMEIFLTRMPSSEYAVEELNQNYGKV